MPLVAIVAALLAFAGMSPLNAATPPGTTTRLFVLEYELAGKSELGRPEADLEQARETIKERLRGRGLPAVVGRIKQQVLVRVTSADPAVFDSVRRELQNRGCVEFRRVHPQPNHPDGTSIPDGYEAVVFMSHSRGRPWEELLWIKTGAEIGNDEVKSAYPVLADQDRFEVIVELTAKGRIKFAALTRRIAEAANRDESVHRVAIMLDGAVLAAPVVRQAIDTDRLSISGRFSQREALELANLLASPFVLPPIREERVE